MQWSGKAGQEWDRDEVIETRDPTTFSINMCGRKVIDPDLELQIVLKKEKFMDNNFYKAVNIDS